MNQHPLDGARLKLVRAEKHLDEALCLIAKFTEGDCTIALEKNDTGKLYVQRVRLTPSGSPEISAIAGDFFGNVRSALDYIVWQLVLTNPPNAPNSGNAFPIANSADDYLQTARNRLNGVPIKAATLIEGLQPYKRRDNPLGILNRLVNIDKHRTLNVVTCVADNTALTSPGGNFSLVIGDEELRDGAVFGGIGMPVELASTFPGFEQRLPTMKMQGKCSTFVAFDDPSAEELADFRVDTTLKVILEFVRNAVVPTFEPFFDSIPYAV